MVALRGGNSGPEGECGPSRSRSLRAVDTLSIRSACSTDNWATLLVLKAPPRLVGQRWLNTGRGIYHVLRGCWEQICVPGM